MPYTVELRFDPDLTARVRALSRALAGIGAASCDEGGAWVPHLSLAVYDDEAEVDEAIARELVAEVAAGGAPIEIAFAGLGVFPTEENVMFLAPVVTPPLLDRMPRTTPGRRGSARPAAPTTCRGAGCRIARSRCRVRWPASRKRSATSPRAGRRCTASFAPWR